MTSNYAFPGRTALFAVPLALAFGLSACSSGSTAEPSATAGGDNGPSTEVAAVIKGLDNPFFQAMEQGIVAEADATGASVNIQAAADIGDTTGQADKLQALAGQDYGCFIVNPISGTNLVQSLAPVGSAGVPIVNIDSPIDADAAAAADLQISTYIGTDNVAAGGKAGDFVVSQVPAGANVAVIGGISGDVTSAARVDGFRGAVEGTLNVVQEEAADWQREVALTKATDILAANPDVVAFFAANDDMGLGIVKAIENAGRAGEIVVVSVDGNPDALESVQAGGLTATVAQYPFAIGKLGLQACSAAIAGATLPANVESPTALVTADVAQQAIDAFPEPFEAFENPLENLG